VDGHWRIGAEHFISVSGFLLWKLCLERAIPELQLTSFAAHFLGFRLLLLKAFSTPCSFG
jgi:hypothetical protein